jgi:hypothetical protein
MSARVLLSGVLDKAPVRMTSKAGKTYLRACVKAGNGPDAKRWTIFVFSETAVEALEAITVGEAFAASGPFEANTWAPEGREPRVNLTVTADAILTGHKPKNRVAKSTKANGRAVAAASWAAPARAEVETPRAGKGADFNDSIPF